MSSSSCSPGSETLYYCGFNGFSQVPSSSNHTLTTLVQHPITAASKSISVVDVAICWNYLVVADEEGISKYGLLNGGKTSSGCQRIKWKQGKIRQMAATPRHLLVCTEKGECWTHEEGKGWRQVMVGTEAEAPPNAAGKATSETREDSPQPLIDLKEDSASSSPKKRSDSTGDNDEDEIVAGGGKAAVSSVHMVKTSCGDNHNIGLDCNGVAYSLPSPLEFDTFPSDSRHRVIDVACGKEHCLLLTEHGQVYSWGGGSRGQLGHGTLSSEERPRLITALDGLRIKKIAAGGWHSACISQFDDLYMFGWNESGQLAQTTNLVKPAECFSAVEKLLMACCTMQPDTAHPRGDSEDCEVYHKQDECGPDEANNKATMDLADGEKDALTCYNATCNDNPSDLVVVQSVPMLVQIPGEIKDVGCGSRHTVVLTKGNQLWGFGWNKYGQLGLGHTLSRDSVEKISMPKGINKNSQVKMLRCGDWGTVLVASKKN